MSQDNEDTDEVSGLDEVSIRFLRAVKVLKGDQKALQVLDAIKSVLGEDWAARVIFNKLSDNFSTIEGIAVVGFDINNGMKINAIKELRTITGLGLKEAKDAIEGAGCGNKTVCGIPSNLPPKQVEESIQALRRFGVKIVIT